MYIRLILQDCVYDYSVVEKVVRERFAKALGRGMQDLKINRATSSPINGLIENAVIEVGNKFTRDFLVYIKSVIIINFMVSWFTCVVSMAST